MFSWSNLQRNTSVGRGLKLFIFWPYGFDNLWFLKNVRRGAMRSKTQWVFYRDLEWWPGPQKVQFWKTTGYPEVVGLILALLRYLPARIFMLSGTHRKNALFTCMTKVYCDELGAFKHSFYHQNWQFEAKNWFDPYTLFLYLKLLLKTA